MFKSIYQYELKYWLKKPATYFFAIIFFSITFVAIAGMAGESTDRFNGRVLNSASYIYDLMRKVMYLLFFLLPVIIGQSVHRDIAANVHPILNSYPITKNNYIWAKFLSSFTVLMLIVGFSMLGFFLATQMPWTNPELLKQFEPMAYLQVFGGFLLPNLLLLSILVFGVVLLSRNIYLGFVSVLLFLLVPQLTGAYFSAETSTYLAAIFDPLGRKSVTFYTKNWTISEQNELLLPVKGVIIYNRLFWLGVSSLSFTGIYGLFQLHQEAPTISFKNKLFTRNKTIDTTKGKVRNLGTITKVDLPNINLIFSKIHQLKTMWRLSIYDLKYMLKNKAFLSLLLGGLILVLLMMKSVQPRFDTETFPMTWKILELPSQVFSGIINFMTFLFAGFLVQRSRMAKTQQLVDISPFPNWVFLGSKFLALVKMQMVLLFVVMIGGILTQLYKGYFNFEIDQYLLTLYGLNLIHFVIWSMLAVFMHTFLDRPYLTFFLLLFIPVGCIGISEFGPQFLGMDFLEQWMFRYNQGPGGVFGLRYSDMDGYGANLPPYFIYKFYWLLAGNLLMLGALLFWKRGYTYSFIERLGLVKQRFKGRVAVGFFTCLLAFLSMGFMFYYDGNIANNYYSRANRQHLLSEAKQKYQDYEKFVQPKITSIKIELDIFPEERRYTATGKYWLKNQSNQNIDTLIINYVPDLHTSYDFQEKYAVLSKDTIANIAHFDIIVVENSLAAGDSLQMTFTNYSDPVTWLSTNELIKANGTLIRDGLFPRLGNWLFFFQEVNSMGKHTYRPHPTDSLATVGSWTAIDADRIDFEAIISTSADQIALSSGALQKEWTVNNRNYFHYKTQEKISAQFVCTSGYYEVKKDKWKDIDLAVYYDKKHRYNVDNMLAGMKASLAYCSENFSPYQFKQVRLVEFAQTGGASAHGYPGFIPTGEGAGFIADVAHLEHDGWDMPFSTGVHEVAHQWWGNQVIPADVLGVKMVVESMAEYVTTMVEKKEKGIQTMRRTNKGKLKQYLEQRRRDRLEELPLMYAEPHQNYIHYPKGALVMYAMSDYIGEQRLNKALKKYVEKVAFQEERYTTSIELVDYIRAATPDSLQYLINDFFETITLYDNRVLDWTATPLNNGQYQIDLDFLVRKYRHGGKGKELYSDNGIDSLSYQLPNAEKIIHSLPLADYLEIGIFDENGQELYLQKNKISQIQNRVSIIVDALPTEVGVDPYFKLIDREMGDNQKKK